MTIHVEKARSLRGNKRLVCFYPGTSAVRVYITRTSVLPASLIGVPALHFVRGLIFVGHVVGFPFVVVVTTVSKRLKRVGKVKRLRGRHEGAARLSCALLLTLGDTGIIVGTFDAPRTSMIAYPRKRLAASTHSDSHYVSVPVLLGIGASHAFWGHRLSDGVLLGWNPLVANAVQQ